MDYCTLISARDLLSQIDSPDLRILDCRFSLADPSAGESAYRQSHLPGAIYAHLERHLSGPITNTSGRHPLPEVNALATEFGGWGIEPTTQVVAYDDVGGAFAARIWWLLRWLGHSRAAVLDGGWQAWQSAGGEVSADVFIPVPTPFDPREVGSAWLTASEVQVALAAGSIHLVDAREPTRFAGDTEPLDPVAGHVPGAINRPYKQNLREDSTFAAVEILRSRFTDLSDREVVHMCGSGVTACHNLLAMTHAGMSPGKLYAGSWSEWCREPSRGVARGQ